MMQAIRFYKEASSFNNQYAKNNLGIIYKNGFGNEIKPRLGLAIEYFNEAIKQKNDKAAMYNLAHLFLYEEPVEDSINKSIDLLIMSVKNGFEPSLIILLIALVKVYGYNTEKIIQRLHNHKVETIYISEIISQMLQNSEMNDLTYNELFLFYKNIDYLYDFTLRFVQSNRIINGNEKQGQIKVRCSSIFFLIL